VELAPATSAGSMATRSAERFDLMGELAGTWASGGICRTSAHRSIRYVALEDVATKQNSTHQTRVGLSRERAVGSAEWDAERGAHLTAAEPFTEGQPEDISDLPHGDAGSWHGLSSDGMVRGDCRARLTPASANGNPFTRCTKTSESVYGFDRNGCTGIGRNPQHELVDGPCRDAVDVGLRTTA